MGNRKPEQNTDQNIGLDHDESFDENLDEVIEEIDVDDIIAAVNGADPYESRRKSRHRRNSRRRLDEMAHERALKRELFYWNDDPSDLDYNYDDWN